MSLPALSNEPNHVFQEKGYFDYIHTIFNTYENRYTKYDVIPVHRSVASSYRSGNVNSPVRTVAGIPWRDPTSFHRQVERFSYEAGYEESSFIEGILYLETKQGFECNFNPDDLVGDWARPDQGLMDTDEHRKAVVECLLRLNEGKVQLGQFLAEAKESAEQIASTGETLLKLLLAVKHGKLGELPRDFRTVRRAAGDIWLQWQYGWKPLCADLYGMYDLMKNGIHHGPVLKAKRSVSTPHEGSYYINGNLVEEKSKHRDNCHLWAKINNQLLTDANSIGVTNPLSLGWEVVPYSFVVDWFCPIGNYLQAVTAKAGLDFVGGFTSQVREGEFTIHGNVGTCTKKFFYFHREALANFPNPGVYAEAKPLNPSRWASALALLNQLF